MLRAWGSGTFIMPHMITPDYEGNLWVTGGLARWSCSQGRSDCCMWCRCGAWGHHGQGGGALPPLLPPVFHLPASWRPIGGAFALPAPHRRGAAPGAEVQRRGRAAAGAGPRAAARPRPRCLLQAHAGGGGPQRRCLRVRCGAFMQPGMAWPALALWTADAHSCHQGRAAGCPLPKPQLCCCPHAVPQTATATRGWLSSPPTAPGCATSRCPRARARRCWCRTGGVAPARCGLPLPRLQGCLAPAAACPCPLACSLAQRLPPFPPCSAPPRSVVVHECLQRLIVAERERGRVHAFQLGSGEYLGAPPAV